MSSLTAKEQFRVSHADIVKFADEQVNLGRDDVGEYREQVNRLRVELADHIAANPAFDLVKMLHSGSVAKGTALKTINDMDVAVYIKAGAAPGDEAELIDWLAARLREAYPNLKPEQFEPQQHCVTVKFKGTGLDVDVVPILYEGDPDNRGYLITKDTGERVLTSVSLHLEFIRKRKKAQPTHFAQVVRLVKWWARLQKRDRAGFRLKSFLIELIVAYLADRGVSLSDYPSALEQIFAFIVQNRFQRPIVFSDYYSESDVTPDGSPIQVFDPVNPENNVAKQYTAHERDLLLEAAEDALDAIAYAQHAMTKAEVINCWQQIFGVSFKV